ncbi:MAG: UvrD-helicase domain-containing protein [Clostridium sp.]|nr:UvrD-helicase domain-containing protein [Bacteroides sp.]MCM1197754.1 UvrD-helicase domain-containing protein [Clostridium sp.]
MIQIMKASAGSGKTFNLAKTYIRLLFEAKDSHSYRHILAVTFTNKATDEMKGRILKELFVLSVEPEASGYFRDFVPSLAKSPSDLKKLAEDLLCNILHDYGAFSVSTIDRFFQQTLKAFSREIGQFASYQVELDKDSLVEESVDRILDSLTENDSALLKWLTDNVLEQIETGGRYSLDKSLKDMAKRLRSNGHRDQIERYGIDENGLYSKETLDRIRKECRSVISGYYDKVRSTASRVLGLMLQNGVDPAGSNRKFLSKLHVYAGLKNSDVIPFPTDTFLKNASDHELWFPKAKARTLLPKVYPLIEEPLNDFCALFDADYRVFSTAKIIDGQLYGLGVAGELNGTFRDLMKEKNVLCLDDSNTILKGIIDGSDAPFVYEKLGVRYEHFLLDEFQDTSRIQWDNFRPLLQNSEAQGFDSLIVGDVKQSIYRWRDSDWNLLDSELEKEFDRVKVDSLQSNYRSLSCIVRFNNMFFPVAARVLDDTYDDKTGGRSLSGIYSDVEQAVAVKGDETGSVCLTWCGKDDENRKVLESIATIRGKGARYGDIAILVRGNAEGENIASFLIDNNVPVITDESLKVRSSLVVRRLVSLLSFAENPHDTVGGFLASSLDVTLPAEFHSIIDLAENLLRQLRKADEAVFDGETLYVQSFMDFLHDFVSVNGNTLRGFLKHWEEKNPSISSPALGDSVRIMTIHKSKGLDFPYVVFPYAEKVNLYKASSCWCRPETAGTSLEGLPDGIFDVTLSADSEKTLFAEDYRKEKKMQYVDNINILYVAFTRASKGMHIIASAPSQKFLDAIEAGQIPEFADMSQILYWFVDRNCSELLPDREGELRFRRLHCEDGAVSYMAGEFFDFAAFHARKAVSAASGVQTFEIHAGYPSWPLDGRLLFRTEGADFFADDGRAGVSASHRLRGIVLHDILSCVVVPSDLEGAVANARQAGKLTDSEASEAFALLSGRIGKASARGWFPEDPSMVRNEVSLIETDGSVYRPDRMVFVPDGGVIIIDYKFGTHRKSYESQVARYADICRRMGYFNVTTALWYVDSDEVR